LSKSIYNDLQFFNCKKKEYAGVAVGDRCIYHEHLKAVSWDKKSEALLTSRGKKADEMVGKREIANRTERASKRESKISIQPYCTACSAT